MMPLREGLGIPSPRNRLDPRHQFYFQKVVQRVIDNAREISRKVFQQGLNVPFAICKIRPNLMLDTDLASFPLKYSL